MILQGAQMKPAAGTTTGSRWTGAVGEEPAIRADRLTKAYGPIHAVQELSFTVPSGTVAGFVGPNGAGKTTTIRMLLGLVAPTSGTASVLGVPIGRGALYLPRIGALIEGSAFYPTHPPPPGTAAGPASVGRCLVVGMSQSLDCGREAAMGGRCRGGRHA